MTFNSHECNYSWTAIQLFLLILNWLFYSNVAIHTRKGSSQMILKYDPIVEEAGKIVENIHPPLPFIVEWTAPDYK